MYNYSILCILILLVLMAIFCSWKIIHVDILLSIFFPKTVAEYGVIHTSIYYSTMYEYCVPLQYSTCIWTQSRNLFTPYGSVFYSMQGAGFPKTHSIHQLFGFYLDHNSLHDSHVIELQLKF